MSESKKPVTASCGSPVGFAMTVPPKQPATARSIPAAHSSTAMSVSVRLALYFFLSFITPITPPARKRAMNRNAANGVAVLAGSGSGVADTGVGSAEAVTAGTVGVGSAVGSGVGVAGGFATV